MTPEDWSVVWFTTWVSALSTLVITPPGLAMAWFLARRSWRGKVLVETIVSLPLVLPPVATGLLLLKVCGRRGPIGSWLFAHFGTDIVFTWRAVLVALAVMSFPLLVRSARVAIEEVPVRLEQIAATLGASPARVLATITLPLAMRGIAGGMLLAFARALGEFGATIMLAGNIPGQTTTLSMSIFQSVQLGDDTAALRLVGIAVLMAFVSIWISESFTRRRTSMSP